MSNHKTLLKKFDRLGYIFLLLAVFVFYILSLIDASNASASGISSILLFSLTGNIFLAVCLAVFSVTIVCFVLTKYRKSLPIWVATSVMCFLLIGFSFFAFHNGRRIVSEADGPASLSYSCIWSENSATVENITSKFSKEYSNKRNTNLCILKNMPLAASNYAPGNSGYNQFWWDYSIVAVYGAFVLFSYLGSRYIFSNHGKT